MVIIRLHRGFQDTRNTLLPLFYVATCTTLFRDAAYLGAFIFNTSANSCWLGRLVIPQDTTCRPISRTKVLAITSTSIEGLLPPPREQTHTHTRIYIYIGSIFQTLRGAMVAEPIASRMLLYTPCFSIPLCLPPLSRSRSRSTCGECSHGDYKWTMNSPPRILFNYAINRKSVYRVGNPLLSGMDGTPFSFSFSLFSFSSFLSFFLFLLTSRMRLPENYKFHTSNVRDITLSD